MSNANTVPPQYPKLSRVRLMAIALCVISLLLYANTLFNSYAIDDTMVLTENKYVQQGVAGIPHLLASHHLEGFGSNDVSDYYRPLSLVMFAVEYQLWGLNPMAGHLVNMLFFNGCVLLLFVFLNKLLGREKVTVSFMASLLFAVHPIHTEVVANIKSRDELMCFFFGFAALILFINYAARGNIAQALGGTFCLFLAILSKETVITFVAVVPLIFFFYINENRKRSVIITLCTIAVAAIFIGLWAYAQSRHPGQERLHEKLLNSMPGGTGESLSIPAKILILGWQLRLLFIPYPLSFSYDIGAFSTAGFMDIGVLASLAAYIALIGIAAFRIKKSAKDPWAFAILFYLITLSLYSNIIFVLGQPLANRYMFFPSVGFCLVLALAADRWLFGTTGKTSSVTTIIKTLAAPAALIICFSAMTLARNTDWKDNFTLISADFPKSPDNYMTQYRMGLELAVKYTQEDDSMARERLNDESIARFQKSIELNPGYTESHSDLGVDYFRKGYYDSAEYHYKVTLALNPRHFNAAHNLATLYYKMQRYPEAIRLYHATLSIDSNTADAWYNMGVCYARIKSNDSSLFCMKKVIAIAPRHDNYKSYGNVAILYKMVGNADSAAKYEQITKQYFPQFHL